LSTEQYTEAVKNLVVLQKLRPGIVEPHFYAAQALEDLGKSQQAIEAFGQVLDIDANHRPARLALTRLLIRTLQPERARAEWNRLNQSVSGVDIELIELEGALFLLETNPKNAVAAFQKALELDPSKNRVIKLAHAQWLTGRREATITTLVGGLRNFPEDPELRIQLADRYAAMGDFDQAVEHYRLAVGLLPDAAALRNNYAWSLMETGQLENALVEARKAYELDPSAPEIQRLGYATRALGLLLPDARDLGLPFVEITTEEENVASQRVITSNGGELVERFTAPASHGGAPMLRYRIRLT
jgi:tetratricopeptide (TPR) repeat protein